MTIEDKEAKKLGVAAAGGAAVALVLASFTPAPVILGIGLLAASGAYAYKRLATRKDNPAAAQGGQTIDIEENKND